MNATRGDFNRLIDVARRANLIVEGEDILHSDDQGHAGTALVCIDKWLCWRDSALRLQVRVLTRSSLEASWDCIDEGQFSAPLSSAQATQLVEHWGLLERDAIRRGREAKKVVDPQRFVLGAVTFDYAPEGTAIPAYLNGRRWNGWRMPYFPESSMAQVMALCPDVSYDAEKDSYVIREEAYPDEPWSVPAEIITTADGQVVKVFPVGSGDWCWDRASLTTNAGAREALADLEVEQYVFGDGVRVVAQDNWNADDVDDLTKIIYVVFEDDDPAADSHKISFHVRFDAAGQVDDAYGLLMKSGEDIGQRGTNQKAIKAARAG